jgi:myo-inositol-1(or 4)-monophosphatase
VEYLDFAVELARDAGSVLKHYMDRDKHVELKGRANLVTVADKEAEARIIRRIRDQYPAHSILAEESGPSEGNEAKWIIDPLDGTTNFAHQYPFFCVSIALELNGQLMCGAVYDPWRDEMFSAERGKGSFMNGKRLRVSDASTVADALIMTGFSYRVREKMDIALSQFRAFLFESQGVRRGGSAALDLCYGAIGRVDAFWEMDLHPWDTAAGVVILAEAGGRVTDFSGGSFSVYGKEIIASNGRIHDEMIRILKKLS